MISEYRFIISLISSDCLSIGLPSGPMSSPEVAALMDSVSIDRDFKSSESFFALSRSSCSSEDISSSLTEDVSDSPPSFLFGSGYISAKIFEFRRYFL